MIGTLLSVLLLAYAILHVAMVGPLLRAQAAKRRLATLRSFAAFGPPRAKTPAERAFAEAEAAYRKQLRITRALTSAEMTMLRRATWS